METREFGKLEVMIAEFITEAIKKGEFTIELDANVPDSNGWFDATIYIGGMNIRCSFKNNYICWFNNYGYLFKDENGENERALVNAAMEQVKENAIEYRKKRIKELEQELKQLKSKKSDNV